MNLLSVIKIQVRIPLGPLLQFGAHDAPQQQALSQAQGMKSPANGSQVTIRKILSGITWLIGQGLRSCLCWPFLVLPSQKQINPQILGSPTGKTLMSTVIRSISDDDHCFWVPDGFSGEVLPFFCRFAPNWIDLHLQPGWSEWSWMIALTRLWCLRVSEITRILPLLTPSSPSQTCDENKVNQCHSRSTLMPTDRKSTECSKWLRCHQLRSAHPHFSPVQVMGDCQWFFCLVSLHL